MRTWLALIIAPILALTDQSVAYATSGWACANQNGVAVHGVHALFLATTLVFAALAWGVWRTAGPAGESAEAHKRRHFLAGLALASSALSALTIAAMWMPVWLIATCQP